MTVSRLTELIQATLVDETEPWPVPPLETVQEALFQLRDWPDIRDLLEVFTCQIAFPDAVFTLMDHDLISPAEDDRLALHEDFDVAAKPLLRRAYLDAVNRGLVPGRLN